MSVPTVVFQVTAIGRNSRAIDETARSVLYWVRNTPRLGFRHELWLVIEPEGYSTAPSLYEKLRAAGARVLVVPKEYTTPLATRGKARALEFAVEARRGLRLSGPQVWVYHQDEETCVGEDTLSGIAEFVGGTSGLLGAGVILYPLDWGGTASHVQELSRSYDDFRVLDSMTRPGNPTAGFHGSHFLVRADVEDEIGWDSIGYAPAEDLQFEIRVRARFGSVFGILRGFAYEKGAFSLGDQLRQRRRWVHGILHALLRSPELPARRRLTLAYSALSWFSALPSVAILVASVVLHYGPILLLTGVFTGFVWVSMVLAYLEGYRLHAAYIPRSTPAFRLVLAGLLGALVDVVAPWSALLARPSTRDFIPKDRPQGLGRREPRLGFPGSRTVAPFPLGAEGLPARRRSEELALGAEPGPRPS
ncbi:MAG: glycosyltransferase family 2 protein [Thermoplasmata archaeon]|nr:glycosyltransferase family 2 protein [Thermoplasmata archaeon]